MITLMNYKADIFNEHAVLKHEVILVLAEGRKGGNQVIFWIDNPGFQGYKGAKITKTKSSNPSAVMGYNATDLPGCTQENVFEKYPELFL